MKERKRLYPTVAELKEYKEFEKKYPHLTVNKFVKRGK